MATRRFAEDRNVTWITAEVFNIILHPTQCLNNIQRSEIRTAIEALRRALHGWMTEPAEWSEPIVDRNNDHVFGFNQCGEVVITLVA